MFSDLLARSSTVLLSPSPSHACSRDNPITGRADVGRQPPTSNYLLLDQAGIAASPPGHTQTRTGVVSLIDRRTSRDHFSGLMRSGHNGPLDKSLAFGRSRRRIGLPSPKICMRQTMSPVRQRPTPFPVGVTFAKWFQLWGATNTWHGRWPRGPETTSPRRHQQSL